MNSHMHALFSLHVADRAGRVPSGTRFYKLMPALVCRPNRGFEGWKEAEPGTCPCHTAPLDPFEAPRKTKYVQFRAHFMRPLDA